VQRGEIAQILRFAQDDKLALKRQTLQRDKPVAAACAGDRKRLHSAVRAVF